MDMTEEQRAILGECKDIISGKKRLQLSGYTGKGFTPRCIEAPWAASHIKKGDSILDIGFTFASPDYLGMLLEYKDKYDVSIDAVDIIKPEKVKGRYPKEWLNSIFEVFVAIGDIRKIELPVEKYDIVTCISTIEHIGYDEPSRTVEGSAFERKRNKEDVNIIRDPNIHSAVLDNFHKTLKPKGKVLISVPMGRGGAIITRDSLGFYSVEWEYEKDSWREITRNKGFDLKEEMFFKNTPSGWVRVTSHNELSDETGNMKPNGVGCALCVLVKK